MRKMDRVYWLERRKNGACQKEQKRKRAYVHLPASSTMEGKRNNMNKKAWVGIVIASIIVVVVSIIFRAYLKTPVITQNQKSDNAPIATYLSMTEKQLLDVFGTPTGVAEGLSLPESTRTQCPEIDKIYTYGIMYSEGYNDYGGTRFWFSKGKVVAYGRLYSGNINSGYEYYPTLKDVLPPQLLSVKPQQEHHGANVILTWDIGNVKWGATTLKTPIREYNPNKGYYWREPTFKEYRVVYWSVMRDDLSISE